MMRCSKEAWAQCPYHHGCEMYAEFADGSECDQFNEKVMLERDTAQPTKQPATTFEWVAVEERLPELEQFTVYWDEETISGESSELVLVADSDGNTTIARYETGPLFQGWTEEVRQATLHDVTYWAKIPAPPKEATQLEDEA